MNSLLLLMSYLAAWVAPKPLAQPVVTFQRITAATYAQAQRVAHPTTPPSTFPVLARNGQLVIPTSAGPQTYRNVVIDEKAVANGHSEAETTTYT